ncbi:MAG: hypothetical protein Q8O67_19100 [Deltaproteobacteria bacterium]|nr:hypothetical protein [Deltaproteobacteria bacterium]
MAIDSPLTQATWKAHLVAAGSTATKAPAFQKVVEQVIASGVSAGEVKKFLAERNDVFGDDAVQIAKRAGEALLDQTSPKRQTNAPATGVKAHAVRFAGLPWFQRVTLPQPPVLLIGKGDSVVVDGERFSQSDVAALLRAA